MVKRLDQLTKGVTGHAASRSSQLHELIRGIVLQQKVLLTRSRKTFCILGQLAILDQGVDGINDLTDASAEGVQVTKDGFLIVEGHSVTLLRVT